MHSWPLLVFTLAIQAAVGGCLILFLYNSLLKKSLSEDTLEKANSKSLLVLTILSLLGLGFSFFDLGYPLNALNAIRNIGTSWLAREILFTCFFIGFVGLTFILNLKTKKLSQGLLGLAGIAGLAAVFAMGSLYSTTIFEAWNSVNTIIGFYGSSLILGTVVINILFFPVFQNNEASFEEVKLPTLLIILGAFIIQFTFMTALGSGLAALSPTISLMRWLCSAMAALLLAYLYLKTPRTSGLLYLSFGLMLVGEVIGRYLFYLPLS